MSGWMRVSHLARVVLDERHRRVSMRAKHRHLAALLERQHPLRVRQQHQRRLRRLEVQRPTLLRAYRLSAQLPVRLIVDGIEEAEVEPHTQRVEDRPVDVVHGAVAGADPRQPAPTHPVC